MDCVLFRHGIAVGREVWDGPEPERPLTPKGTEKTRQAAAGLVRVVNTPTHLLSSPFARAMETAKVIRDEFRLRTEIQVCDELTPDSPPDKLFAVLAGFPQDACVVCVGHEPHLGEAAGIMLFAKPTTGLSLKKAGACCIEFEKFPRGGQGALRWWLTPAQLRSLRKG